MSSSKSPLNLDVAHFVATIPTDIGTRSPAYRIAELRHVTDMAAIFTVCLCTANSGLSLRMFSPGCEVMHSAALFGPDSTFYYEIQRAAWRTELLRLCL
jgi:hypothetical protein